MKSIIIYRKSGDSLIKMFQTVELYLTNSNYEHALIEVRSILKIVPDNLYAKTIEKRLDRIISELSMPIKKTIQFVKQTKQVVLALIHICQLGICFVKKICETQVHDINDYLKKTAIDRKCESLLNVAKQSMLNKDYNYALSQAKRVLIVDSQNEEARLLIDKINVAIQNVVPLEVNIDDKKLTVEKNTMQVNDKIFKCIAFADYYLNDKAFEESLKYVEEGLKYDSNNKVLLNMKNELQSLTKI